MVWEWTTPCDSPQVERNSFSATVAECRRFFQSANPFQIASSRKPWCTCGHFINGKKRKNNWIISQVWIMCWELLIQPQKTVRTRGGVWPASLSHPERNMLFHFKHFYKFSSSTLLPACVILFLSWYPAQVWSFQLLVSRWQSRSSFETQWNVSPSFLGEPWKWCKPPAKDRQPGPEAVLLSLSYSSMYVVYCQQNSREDFCGLISSWNVTCNHICENCSHRAWWSTSSRH